MARTLASSGVATQVTLLVCVDDDNTTIKDFSSNNVTVTNTGVTVTTSKTWKGVSVPMMTWADATDKLTLGATTPNIVSPACVFFIVKDSAASDGLVMAYGSATGGGSATTTDDPFFAMASNPSPVMRDQLGGNIIALPNDTLAAGDDWSVFYNSDTAWPNVTYSAREASTLSSSAPSFSWNPGGGTTTLNGFLKQIGTNGTPTWTCDIVMFGVLSGLISQADAAAIHADPFGTLFTGGGGGGTTVTLTTRKLLLGVGG